MGLQEGLGEGEVTEGGRRNAHEGKTQGKVGARFLIKPSWAICISEFNPEKEKVVLEMLWE